MKDVYKTWPKSFVAGLDFIKAKDDSVLEHPVYCRRTAELFKTLSSGIMDMAAASPALNFSAITGDGLYDYYRSARYGNPEQDFIISTAKRLCSSLRVSERFYDIEALSFCLLVVQGKNDHALKYLHRLIRPAVMLYRIRDSAHFTGMRGGKPTHKLHELTMQLCGEFMAEHPDARHTEIAIGVRRKLLVNYDRVPAARTIRDWLSKF